MSQTTLHGLTREQIRSLTRPSNLAGAFAVVSIWAVIAACFAALARWPHPITFVLVVVLLGGRQLALAVAMHEAAHGSLFRTRWLNEVLTDWLCAAPVWADVARYRRHHLAHHAYTGTERDPDLGLAPVEPISRASLLRKIARDVLGLSGLRRVAGLLLIDLELLTYNVGGVVLRAPRRGVMQHLRAGARNLCRPVVANLGLALALWALGIGWTYLAWVAGYLTTFSLFIRVRSLAEHAMMERDGDIFRNTRTTRAGLLARATVAPLCVNHHLEHHLLPTVPWFRLPALGRALSQANAIPATARASGYREVLRAVCNEGR
jgi:fatty acid desaturase